MPLPCTLFLQQYCLYAACLCGMLVSHHHFELQFRCLLSICCNHKVILIGHVWVSQQMGIPVQVWMPDEPKTTSSSARSQSMRWNDTPSSPPSSTSSSAAAVLAPDDTQSASTSGRQVGTGAGTQQGPPSWWDPPPTIHVDKRYKDQVCVCLRVSCSWKQCHHLYHHLLVEFIQPARPSQNHTCNRQQHKGIWPR